MYSWEHAAQWCGIFTYQSRNVQNTYVQFGESPFTEAKIRSEEMIISKHVDIFFDSTRDSKIYPSLTQCHAMFAEYNTGM